jgi:hypothetical protein
MTRSVENILYSFELLSKNEKIELASEIMRRTAKSGFPPLTDDELVCLADEVFCELDKIESENV